MEPQKFTEESPGSSSDNPPGDAPTDTSSDKSFLQQLAPKSGMNFGRFRRLALKELREILRDRRTIITLVLMPLLVYPMLSLVLQRVLIDKSDVPAADAKTVVRIAFEDTEQMGLFDRVFFGIAAEQERAKTKTDERADNDEDGAKSKSPNADQAKQTDEANPIETNPPSQPLSISNVEIAYFVAGEYVRSPTEFVQEPAVEAPASENADESAPPQTLEQQVSTGIAELGARISENDTHNGVNLDLIYRQNSESSEQALMFVNEIFRYGNEFEAGNRLRTAGAASETYIDQQTVAVKSAPVNRTNTLATLIPLILTLMTITGAVYPAIDLTAGERERGTLETLIAAPIPRMGILLGKFIAVFTVAQLTALVNMIGMMITIWAFQLDKLLFDDGITLLMIAQIMGLVALFAGFFSAILLAITSFARSFKEAQAYLIPVMLVSMTPALGALMPDLTLNGILVVLPLINMVLLARDILQGNANLSVAIIAIASTVIYGGLALTFAAKIFGTDSILFDNQRGWRSVLRRPKKEGETISVPGAFLCLALLFPANFLWLGMLNRPGQTATERLQLMILGTVLMFALFPMIWLWFNRVKFNTGFGLRKGRWIAYPAAILLGCSLGVLLIQIYSSVDLISDFFADSEYEANEARKKLVQAADLQVQTWRSMPAPLVLAALSVVPAVCEELFFRGMLLQSLRKGTHTIFAVIASGLLFGLFHILSTNLLALERFFPTALLGMVLAIVCVQSRSVIPGMILHTLHNLILVSTAIYNDWLVENNWISLEQESLPLPMVVGAVFLSGVGFIMLFGGNSKLNEAEL